MKPEISAAAERTRRRIALRLLPFVFLMYVVNFVDRVNVSFANLNMSADLGFSDRAYGLGVGLFFIGYVLFEIPGALIVERWSARRWLARIMITWGAFTILTGFVQTAKQFYMARFLVGLAEASFFPGVIVYLTHWFRIPDRAKAIASFYIGVPTATVAGSLIASWILGIGWLGLPGWRWLFVLEGIPPIALGVMALWYLTDRPEQARWLADDERAWIVGELKDETKAKKQIHDYTIWQAFRDRRVLLLTLVWFFALSGAQGSIFFLPTFIKRLSGLPNSTVALLVALPGLVAIVGMLLNGWHADKTGERRWHSAIPIACAAVAYLLLPWVHGQFIVMMVLFTVGGGCLYSCYPTFWSMPTLVLSESAAAASFGLINSIGQLGGLFGPYAVGYLNDRTGSVGAAIIFIGTCYLVAGSVVPLINVKSPIGSSVPGRAAKDLAAVARSS